MNLKKSQDIFEFEFYKKYYEIQDSIKDKKGASKPLNLDKKLKDNQKKIDDILSKYEGVTAEDIKDVVGKAIILEIYTADIAFAEKYSDIYDLTFNELKDNAAVEKYIKDNKNALKSTYLHLYQMICIDINGQTIKPSIARDIILNADGDVKLTNQAYKIYVNMIGLYWRKW